MAAFILLQAAGFSQEFSSSSKPSYLPENIKDVELEYEHVAVMGKISGTPVDSQDPDHYLLVKYLSPVFLQYMRYFIKLEFLPDLSYVKENILFAEDVPVQTRESSDYRAYKADMMYLPSHFDGLDVLISQFGPNEGKIGVTFSLSGNPTPTVSNLDGIQNYVATLISKYFTKDEKAPFELDIQSSKSIDAALISGAKNMRRETENYRNSLHGIYSKNGVTLVFQKHPWYINP